MVDKNPLWDADVTTPSRGAPQPTQAPAPAKPPQQGGNPLWEVDTAPPAVAGGQLGQPEFMQTQRPPAQDMSWGETFSKAGESFVPSLKQYGENIITPFTQPKETLAALGQIGTGAVSKAKGALGFQQEAGQKEQDEAAINALGRFYADRYGSMEGFKRAIAEDPVGVLSDLSLPISGGGAMLAKAPGMVGKVGAGIEKVGRVMDPIGAVTMAPKAVTEAGAAVAAVPASWFTGASMKSLRDATEAGFTANPVFWQHFNGAGTAEDMVNAVKKSISDARRARSAEYLAGMDKLDLNAPLSYDNLNKAMIEARDMVGTKGRISDPNAAAILDDLSQQINAWVSNPATKHTLADFDELKQLIRNVGYKNTRQGSKERAIVDKLAGSVVDTIKSVDEGYANVMEKYSQASMRINDYMKGLTAGDTSTSFRKIINAQKGAGKENILKEIAEINPDIPFMIAGHELRPWLAQGLRGLITSGPSIGAGTYFGAPLIGAAGHLYAQSPKAVGATFYGAGKLGGAPERLYQALPPGTTSAVQQAGRAEQLVGEEEQPNQVRRATGGRVRRAFGGRAMRPMTAEMLFHAAHRAKKKISKISEQILNEPDEAVVKALAIAQREI